MTSPLFFIPLVIPKVWGGQAFGELFGHPLSTTQPYGEAWDISDLPQHSSRVADGLHCGKTIGELWRTHQWDLTSKTWICGRAFPLLVKWLDCQDWLSVQVHPNDRMAHDLLQQPYGKPEIWVVVKAMPTARIYAGLRPDISQERFIRQLEAGTVEECLHSFTPVAGDCVVLPAGTVHAAGGGLLMAEIQQSSDATFRLYDWNRRDLDCKRRPLQIEFALRALDWSQGPISPVRPQSMNLGQGGVRGEILTSRYPFRVERYTLTGPWSVPDQGELAVWMVVEGQTMLIDSITRGSQKISPGRSVLVPATSKISWSTLDTDSTAVLLRIRLPSES